VPLCWQRIGAATNHNSDVSNLKDFKIIKEKLFKNALLSIIKNGRVTINVPQQRTVPLQRKVKNAMFWA